jgi:hypothetical protein
LFRDIVMRIAHAMARPEFCRKSATVQVKRLCTR